MKSDKPAGYAPGSARNRLAGLRTGVLAGYSATAVTTIMPLATLPTFLEKLGEHAWGLVAFSWLLVSLASMLEGGVSQALVREFGSRRLESRDNATKLRGLVMAYERVYWVASAALALVLLFLSPVITRHWLHVEEQQQSASIAVWAAAALLILTLCTSLYRAILLSANEHVRLNRLVSLFCILKYGVGCLIVMHWPTLFAYFAWQLLISLAELVTLASSALRALPALDAPVKPDRQLLKQTLRPVGAQLIATSVSALTAQLDKIVVSAMLPINELAHYSVASALAFGLLRLSYPVQSVLLPYLVASQPCPDTSRLQTQHAFYITAMLIFGIATLYLLVGDFALGFWLANDTIQQKVQSVLPWLLIGAACNALYGIQYVTWVARGRSKAVLHVAVVSLLLSLIVTPIGCSWLGAIGAALGWIAAHITGGAAGLRLMHKSFAKQ